MSGAKVPGGPEVLDHAGGDAESANPKPLAASPLATSPNVATPNVATPNVATPPAAPCSAAAPTPEGVPELDLDGGLCVAAVLLAIDQDRAARVVRGLDHAQLETVTRGMNALREVRLDLASLHRILAHAAHRLRRDANVLGDVGRQVDSVLVGAFGERARGASRGDSARLIARRRFSRFDALPPGDLAGMLAGEHPQIIAVFLAHLDRAKAATVIGQMSEPERADLLYRIATLDRASPDVVQCVLDVMTKKLEDRGLHERRAGDKAWVKAAAEIFKRLDEPDPAILDSVRELDCEVADSILDQMLTFEDLAGLDRRATQLVLSRIDIRTLGIALRRASTATADHFLDNLSRRGRDIVERATAQLGEVKVAEAVEAQRRILTIVRELRRELQERRAPRAGAVP